MSDTYTKLFSSITESTIVSEPVATRWLWVTLLAMADAGGCVYGSVPGLARRANITLAETEAALATFYAPDPYSRTKDNEGRRIEDIDGGWRLLNHGKYAAIRSEAERAEYKRDWDRKNRPSGYQRAKQSDSVRQESDTSPTKSDSPTTPTPTPTLEKQEQKQRARSAPLDIPDWLPAGAWQDWHDYRNSRKGWTHKAKRLSIRKLTELWAQGHDPRAVIEQSIECGWTGLFPIRGLQSARAGPIPQTQVGKTMQGLMALEAMKSGNQLAARRTAEGVPEVTFLGLGTDAGR